MRRLAAGLQPLLAALPEATATDAALKHSYPDWVAELWWRELGPDETLALLRAQNEPPERVVRLNRRKRQVRARPHERNEFSDVLFVFGCCLPANVFFGILQPFAEP